MGYQSNGHGTKEAIKYLRGVGPYAGPGHWNTPDFLKTGGESCSLAAVPGDLCPKQTLTEYVTEMSMWAMASAPLLVSTDIRNLTAIQKHVLLNPDVIAIDQQPTAGTLLPTDAGMPNPGQDPSRGPKANGWVVVYDLDCFPDGNLKPDSKIWDEHGVTVDSSACQAACQADSKCTMFEWSGKSSECWFRFDTVWKLRPAPGRVSGCLQSKVPGCSPAPPGPMPPPSPPTPSPAGCETWRKPLVTTPLAHWDGFKNHYAVAVVNINDSNASCTLSMATLIGTAQGYVKNVRRGVCASECVVNLLALHNACRAVLTTVKGRAATLAPLEMPLCLTERPALPCLCPLARRFGRMSRRAPQCSTLTWHSPHTRPCSFVCGQNQYRLPITTSDLT